MDETGEAGIQTVICPVWTLASWGFGMYNGSYVAEVDAVEEIRLGDRVKMRKTHPCGSDEWSVIRIGADIKIKCLGCGRIVMMERADFVKRRKKVLEQGPVPEADTLRAMAGQDEGGNDYAD